MRAFLWPFSYAKRPSANCLPLFQPYYHHGNRILLGIVATNITLFLLTKVYFIRRNAARAKAWEALSVDERKTYLETTTDSGNRRLDFKFVH